LITKNTDYAVRALLSLAKSGKGYRSAKAIAVEQGIPYQFLRRILVALIRAKFIASLEGAGGGYALAVAAGKIRILDVIRLFQGEVRLSECLFRRRFCQNRGSCVLRKEIVRIERIVQDEFDHLTIGGLLHETQNR
jgi:Rrf2 family protein